MGTTSYFGVSYPESTAYVKDGATAMQTIATGFDSAVAIPTYNNQTGTSYTFALVDAAKVVSSNNAGAVTFTIPPQSSVTWGTGTTLTVANYGAGSVTIAGGSGVTVTNAGATVGQYGSASIIRTASDAWTVIPFAGGAALLSDSAISGTTGSPSTATYTSGGINYKTYKFTGSGSITLTKAGLCDVLLVGAGGGAGGNSWAGGGGGGAVITTQIYLPIGTHTIVVGAGGGQGIVNIPGDRGYPTALGLATNTYYNAAVGGGGGGSGDSNLYSTYGQAGASGGGGGAGTNAGAGGAIWLTGIGYAGGTKSTGGLGACGGGGAGAAGGAGVNNSGGNGGVGIANTFVDGSTSVYYGGGGLGNGSPAGSNGLGGGGTANTGGGGGYAAGGSGLAVVRVKA